jgi:hypothetical protein
MSNKSNLFGFSLIPLKSWLVMPVYIGGYTIINMIMNLSRSGLAFSLIFNVLGQQMELSWKIGKISSGSGSD